MPLRYTSGEFTGIYRETSLSADDPESMKKFFKAMTDSMDIDVRLDRLERQALKTFSENCTRDDWYESLPSEAEPSAKDAREVLWQIKIVRDFMKQNDLRNAVMHALMLGHAAERMVVRTAEPLALRGYKELQDSRKSQEAAHGTRQEKQREWAKWQQEVDRIYGENSKPILSHRAMARLVAHKFRVSEKSILRRTHNPKCSCARAGHRHTQIK